MSDTEKHLLPGDIVEVEAEKYIRFTAYEDKMRQATFAKDVLREEIDRLRAENETLRKASIKALGDVDRLASHALGTPENGTGE